MSKNLSSPAVTDASCATSKPSPLLSSAYFYGRKQKQKKEKKLQARRHARRQRIQEKQMSQHPYSEHTGVLLDSSLASDPYYTREQHLVERARLMAQTTQLSFNGFWYPGMNYKAYHPLRNLKRKIRRIRAQDQLPKLIPRLCNEQGLVDGLMGAAGLIERVANFCNATKYTATNEDVGNTLIARAEDILLLCGCLSHATNITQFLSAILLYIRTHHPRAYTPTLVRWIKSLFQEHFKQQSGSLNDDFEVEEEQENGFSLYFKEFIVTLKLGLANWSKIVHSRMFQSVSTLLTLLTVFGLVSKESLPENITDISKFMSRKLEPKFKESKTIYEACMEVMLFTAEKLSDFVTTGNWWDIFVDKNDVDELSDEYNALMQALPLLEANKLHELSDHRVAGIKHPADLSIRLVNLMTKLRKLRNNERSDYVKAALNQKLSNLLGLESALIRCQKTTVMRERPFCVQIFGPSGVAKSTLIEAVKKQICDANNIPYEEHNVVYVNEADKFDTEFTHHTTVVILDDLGNVHPDKNTGKSPTQMIIDLVNNVPKLAVKADLADKGNIPKAAQLVIITTNVEDMHAKTYSSEPASILRRMDAVLKVHLKSTHADNTTNAFSREAFLADRNAWAIDYGQVQIVRATVPGKKDQCKFECAEENGSILNCLSYLKALSVKHYSNQKGFLKEMREIRGSSYCKHGHISYFCNECIVPKGITLDEYMETQSGWDACRPIDDEEEDQRITVWSPFHWFHQQVTDFWSGISDWWEFRTRPKTKYLNFSRLVNIRLMDDMPKSILNDFDLGEVYANKWKMAAYGLLGVGVATGLYCIISALRTTREAEKLVLQSAEEKPEEEIDSDDEPPPLMDRTNVFGEARENIWKKPVFIPPPTTEVSHTTTIAQLNAKIERCLGVFKVQLENESWNYCNTLPLCSNLWIVPKHMLPPYGTKAKCVIDFQHEGELGRVYEFLIGKANRYDLPDDDFSVLQVVPGGPQTNFFDYMPDKRTTSIPPYCTHQYRSKSTYEVNLKRVKMGRHEHYVHPSGNFTERWAVGYDYVEDTFPGLCMAPLCSYTSKPYLLGFHRAGGAENKNLAMAAMVDREMFWPALQYFELKGLMVSNAGEFPVELYGKKLILNKGAHKNHCVNFVQDVDGRRPNVEIFGSLDTPRAKFKSYVQTSPISEFVEEEMLLEKKHGKPDGKCINKHWQRDLQQSTCPHNEIDPDLLQQAMLDAKQMYRERVPDHMLANARPLTLDEALSGIDGAYGIDAMNFSTSVGFPLNTKKANFVTPSERKVHNISRPLDLDPMYVEKVKEIEDTLASGQRVYTIFRACLKDEPTKYTKDKIRVFCAAEFAFSIVARKYLLPFLAILQTLGPQVGCTVGTNCYSQQWTELYQHLSKFSQERFIAGDFAAFDKNISPWISRAGDQVLLWLAERCPGYTDRDRMIILGLITEGVHPVVEYDGVLLQFNGTTPSGTVTTVHSNIFRNIIYSRLTYYFLKNKRVELGELTPDKIPWFHEVVAEAYYGDDDAEGVSNREEDYNHTTKTLYLKSIGVKFTLPDKTEGIGTKFMNKKNLTLLKRSFVWDSKLRSYRCPIEEDSIARMLHCYMKSSSGVLPEQIAADALGNAAREYYQYGRGTYDVRVRQLRRVAKSAGIDDLVRPFMTYDEFTENLQAGYFNKPDLVETHYVQQSGESSVDEEMNSLINDLAARSSRVDRIIDTYCIRHFGVPLDRVWPSMPEWAVASPLLMSVLYLHNPELYHMLHLEEMLVQMDLFTGPRYSQQSFEEQGGTMCPDEIPIVRDWAHFATIGTEEEIRQCSSHYSFLCQNEVSNPESLLFCGVPENFKAWESSALVVPLDKMIKVGVIIYYLGMIGLLWKAGVAQRMQRTFRWPLIQLMLMKVMVDPWVLLFYYLDPIFNWWLLTLAAVEFIYDEYRYDTGELKERPVFGQFRGKVRKSRRKRFISAVP